MSKTKFKYIRWRLCEEQDWRCHWCGVRMVWWDSPQAPGSATPKNAATLDHLFHRLTPERQGKASIGARRRYVAACRRCNELRGQSDHERLRGKEQKRGQAKWAALAEATITGELDASRFTPLQGPWEDTPESIRAACERIMQRTRVQSEAPDDPR